MNKYRVEVYTSFEEDPTPLWELSHTSDDEDKARAYAASWNEASPEIPTRVIRQEVIADYRGVE